MGRALGACPARKRKLAERKGIAMNEEERNAKRRELEDKRQKALEAESQAFWDTAERVEARRRVVREAEDGLARLDIEERYPELSEEKVTLVAPSPLNITDGALGVEWVDGRCQLPRSVAERLAAEFPYYEVEEV